MNLFAEVIVPLPLNTLFTYSVPEEMKDAVKVGSRVIVPFGLRKYYTAVVVSLTPVAPVGYEIKPIADLLDDGPVVIHPQLKFWEWVSDYYLSSIGDVMRAALPAGLKVESETFVELARDFDASEVELSEEEAIVCQMLSHHGRMMVGDLERKSGLMSSVGAVLSAMLVKGVVVISEKIVERYHAVTDTMVAFAPESATDPQWRARAFLAIKGAKKQETLLLAMYQFIASGRSEVPKAELMDKSGCSAAIIKVLQNKGILTVYKKEVNRFNPVSVGDLSPLPDLSPAQSAAFDDIRKQWRDDGKSVVLLRGVTSSGKTEVYIRLIDRMLRSGHQVLYLVPEIALTTQLTGRLQSVFGAQVVVYHSKFTDNERVDIWRRLLRDGSPCVVIGARSSVFLPFHRLGLVIVDEEHEPSYKQFDPAPRYNARDAAIVLAGMHGAKVLLGSASPSVETYHKALAGRYGLVELTERFGGVRLPEVEIVDMTREFKILGSYSLISRATSAAVKQALADKRQAIIFHNRRGFAPLARCKQCAHVPKCIACDVSLTYHRRQNQLVCHYCGATYPLPSVCPVCREPSMEIVGYGTERVEDMVQTAFSGARILRMDMDSTRNKDGYQEIINKFSAREADVLVGTQMVTKGLDFDGVSVVGVLSADMLVNYPDFRSSERAFNMLMQVAGRAGRRDIPGRVLVQTTQPSHPVMEFVRSHDYKGFFDVELEERRRFHYPPFTRLISIYLKHRDEESLCVSAELYGRRLRDLFGNRVLGPEEPVVGRIQSLYIRKILLKIEVDASINKVKALLRELYGRMCVMPQMKGTMVYYDVDPL